MPCPKCGSPQYAISHVADNALVNSSSMEDVKTEFLYSIEYEIYYKVKAAKEHLLNKCGCGYSWRTDIKGEKG